MKSKENESDLSNQTSAKSEQPVWKKTYLEGIDLKGTKALL